MKIKPGGKPHGDPGVPKALQASSKRAPFTHRGGIAVDGAMAVGHFMTTANAFNLGFGLVLGALGAVGVLVLIGIATYALLGWLL